MHTKGIDYDVYTKNGDCKSCKEICRNDTNCEGVDCGHTVSCTWWKVGICGSWLTQSSDDAAYTTCMKYDKGSDFNYTIYLHTSC